MFLYNFIDVAQTLKPNSITLNLKILKQINKMAWNKAVWKSCVLSSVLSSDRFLLRMHVSVGSFQFFAPVYKSPSLQVIVMVKIFIGNLSSTATAEELRVLFEKYGNVSECDIVKNYGFVHMPNTFEAEQAIQNLNQHELHGWPMNVEISKGRPKATTKLHVSNLGEGVTSSVLRAKFEEFGTVVECDIVKDYAFVHMERMEDAMDAIEKMDNTAFKGDRPLLFVVRVTYFWLQFC